MICVGIYAVLITGVAFTSDITGSLWSVMGFTVLLAFTLFKTVHLQNPYCMHIKEGGDEKV